MSIDPLILAALGLFGFGVLWWVVDGGRGADLDDRVNRVVMGQGARKNADNTAPERQQFLEQRLKSAQKRREAEENQKRSLEDKLLEAGLPISRQRFFQFSGLSALVGAAIGFVIGGKLMAVFFLLIFGLWLPNFSLNFLAGRRRKMFVRDLADALEAVVRGLKAGLPVGEALTMIAREFRGPIATEFSITVDEQKIGFTLAEALSRTAHRMPVPEMNMLAIAISIQAQTGGSLSETFENLASVIRGRIRLKRKIKTLTSEAKASAMIIGALPFLIMGAMTAINPGYMAPLFETPVGYMLLGGSGFWMSLGILVMVKMVSFKV